MTINFDAIRQAHPLIEVAARYVDLTRKGGEYVAVCCFHADKNPSLYFYRGRDGVGRYRCFACGATGDVIDFVAEVESIDKAEAVKRLDGEQLPMPNTRPPRELPPDESADWEPIVPVPDDAPAYDPAQTYNPRRAKVVRYSPTLLQEWRREDGALIGYVARLEFGDGEKLCPVISYCAGPGGVRRWCARRPKAPYPLVGCEELARRPAAPVILVEGEKKRVSLQAAAPAFVVVSLLGGAECAKANDLAPLQGRTVYLWPDADAPGRRAMRDVGERLLPVATSHPSQ